ncbi:MAG: ABC transporter ATP-binding protein [Caldisericales bacterium]|nr:ABC transporter ATP-binding protein [Caldisericales bacterium]
MEAIVKAKNLTKSFGGTVVLENLNFEIAEGESFGFLGPSKSGKTTLIEILASLTKPTSGEIWVGGVNMGQNPGKARRIVSLVPQTLALYQDFSAHENMKFFGSFVTMSPRKLKEVSLEALDLFDLTHEAHIPIEQLPYSYSKRLSIAVAMLSDPRIILLESPTEGLDDRSARIITDGLNLLSNRGKTIIIATSYTREIASVCRKVGIINRGSLLALDYLENILSCFGEQNQIELEAEGLENIPLDIIRKQLFCSIPIESIDKFGSTLLIKLESTTEVLSIILEALSDSGIPVKNIRLAEGSLENVFYKLAGRELRD